MSAKSMKDLAPGERLFVGGGLMAYRTKKGEIRYGISYRNAAGKPVREMVGPSATVARDVLKRRQADVVAGRYGLPTEADKAKSKKPKRTLHELCRVYLDHAKQHKRSWKRDSGVLDKLKAFLPDKPLAEVSAWDIERFKAHSVKTLTRWIVNRYGIDVAKKKRQAGVNRELAIIKHMFNKAIEWEFLSKNPVTRGMMFKEGQRTYRAFTDPEQAALLEACKGITRAPHLYPIVLLALNTGMRRGEILNLTWEAINLTSRRLVVQVVEGSKSDKARELPLNGSVLAALKALDGPRDGFVFSRLDGRPYKRLTRSYGRALEDAKITDPDATFHSCRHTFATNCVRAGVDVKTLQELLGHADIEMTLRYTHTSWSAKQDAVNRLEELNIGESCSARRVHEISRPPKSLCPRSSVG